MTSENVPTSDHDGTPPRPLVSRRCRFRSCNEEGERNFLVIVVDAAPKSITVWICTKHRHLLTNESLASMLLFTMEDRDDEAHRAAAHTREGNPS